MDALELSFAHQRREYGPDRSRWPWKTVLDRDVDRLVRPAWSLELELAELRALAASDELTEGQFEDIERRARAGLENPDVRVQSHARATLDLVAEVRRRQQTRLPDTDDEGATMRLADWLAVALYSVQGYYRLPLTDDDLDDIAAVLARHAVPGGQGLHGLPLAVTNALWGEEEQ